MTRYRALDVAGTVGRVWGQLRRGSRQPAVGAACRLDRRRRLIPIRKTPDRSRREAVLRLDRVVSLDSTPANPAEVRQAAMRKAMAAAEPRGSRRVRVGERCRPRRCLLAPSHVVLRPTQSLLVPYPERPRKNDFMACGSSPMIISARQMGVAARHICVVGGMHDAQSTIHNVTCSGFWMLRCWQAGGHRQALLAAGPRVCCHARRHARRVSHVMCWRYK